MSNIVTCVYCGHQYPEGTPTHQAEELTAHIKVCEKHPMREAEDRIKRLTQSLAGLVGASTLAECDSMELAFRTIPGAEEDKVSALNAIHALRAEFSRPG